MIEDWKAMMAQAFPLATADELWSLEWVDGRERDGLLVGVLRTINWDRDGESRWIRDIKEQEVMCGRGEHFELRERYAAFLDALGRVLAKGNVAELDRAMPMDVVPADVLDLVSARDVDDFVTALQTSKRLGPFLLA